MMKSSVLLVVLCALIREVGAQKECCVTGDPHFKPYDSKGVRFDFQGYAANTYYLLSKTCQPGVTPFKISSKFELCNGGQPFPGVPISCTTETVIELTLIGVPLKFTVDSAGNVKFGTSPIPQALPINISILGHWVKVTRTGNVVELTTSFGLRVRITYGVNISPNLKYQNVCIYVPAIYQSKLCGLCGDYNGDFNNDKLCPILPACHLARKRRSAGTPGVFRLVNPKVDLYSGNCTGTGGARQCTGVDPIARDTCMAKIKKLLEHLGIVLDEETLLGHVYECAFDVTEGLDEDEFLKGYGGLKTGKPLTTETLCNLNIGKNCGCSDTFQTCMARCTKQDQGKYKKACIQCKEDPICWYYETLTYQFYLCASRACGGTGPLVPH